MKFLNYYPCILFFSLFIFSCSSDDNGKITDENNQEANIVISNVKTSYRGVPEDPNASVHKTIGNSPLVNNQFQKTTLESFSDGVSQNVYIGNEYFYYNNGSLRKLNSTFQGEDETRDFVYDENSNLKQVVWQVLGESKYYIFTEISPKKYYFEWLTLPLDDPSTEIVSRIIVEFDDNQNIVKAGRDNDRNGTMDYKNIFEYSSDNDLIAVHFNNGEIHNIEYTDIVDTESFIQDETFGKKTGRLMSAQIYALSNIESIKNLSHSYHLSKEKFFDADYEVLDNGFFKKRTITEGLYEGSSVTETYILEYTFQ